MGPSVGDLGSIGLTCIDTSSEKKPQCRTHIIHRATNKNSILTGGDSGYNSDI